MFSDGRDPEVRGEVLPLPRRERRILEYLVNNTGCRVTKTQIFNSVYGLFSEDIDENVVESHISKLRKRLRHRLGYDPIDSQRYLGYRLIVTSDSRSSPKRWRQNPASHKLSLLYSASWTSFARRGLCPMGLYGMMRTSASGMAAQANRLGTVADNIANSSTTGYKRASTEFSSLVLESGTAGAT